MSLSDPRGQFGVHSVCFYNRTTGVPLAYLRVLGECNISFEAEFSDLEGGSQNFPYDTEVSKISSEIALQAREYNPDAMDILMAGTLTENSAEASGAVDGFANVSGTTVFDVDTGIQQVSITEGLESSAKEGKYIIKATAADTATIYAMSDVDGGTFTSDSQDIGTIDFSGGIDTFLASFGLTFEIGSGSLAFDTNDTAEFYVRKINASSVELLFGESGSEFTQVGVIVAGQKQSDGTITYMELYKVAAAGMPVQFAENGWSEWSITMKALYDSSKDAVGKFFRTIAA